jgi:hypothetical protein
MSPQELLITLSVLLALATLRIGLPLSITWLLGKFLKTATTSSS